MPDLSPAARAVDRAIADRIQLLGEIAPSRQIAAAALRAAADRAENVHPAKPSTEWGEGWLEGVQDVVAGFRCIAAELENNQ